MRVLRRKGGGKRADLTTFTQPAAVLADPAGVPGLDCLRSLVPDAPQTWPSFLCHVLVSFLGFLLLLITFPISGWFALKVSKADWHNPRVVGPHGELWP